MNAFKGEFKAIAVDPGVTSGIVLIDKHDGNLNLWPLQQKLTPLGLLEYLQEYPSFAQVIICEDFEFRGRSSPQGLLMTPAHLIGIVMAYAEKNKSSLFIQKAAYAKGGFYANKAALKKAGVWVENQQHAMDAMRHFMQWFTFGPGYKFNDSPKVVLNKC